MSKLQALLGCGLTLVVAGCDPTPSPSASAEKSQAVPTSSAPGACSLKLGYEAWEPYQYTGLDQKAAGLDIELISAVGNAMGCKIIPSQGAWMELVAALRDGRIDLVAGASKTSSREQFAYFSAPYRQEQFQLFVLTAKSAAMPEATLTDFISKGHKVGIISEYYYGAEYSELAGNEAYKSQFIEASLGELNIARLVDGDIDGMLEDSFVARSMLRRKGLSNQIGPQGISLQSNDVYVMFSKASVPSETVLKFNQGLKNIRNSGEYMLIIDKYQN